MCGVWVWGVGVCVWVWVWCVCGCVCYIVCPSSTDNTPEIVVRSLLEGGAALRHVAHRHLLPLLACHASDSEQPMLLFPKTALGTLKTVLLRTRDNKTTPGGSQRGTLVSPLMCTTRNASWYHLAPPPSCVPPGMHSWDHLTLAPLMCTGSEHSGPGHGGCTDI